MVFILSWIALSALMGWFGRKRLIGFWGFFIVSILLSPVVTGLFLILAAPGKRYIRETEERVAASMRLAGMEAAAEAVVANAMPVGVQFRGPRFRRLLIAWVVVIAAFAGAYLAMAPSGGGGLTESAFGIADAVRLSFDIATMGPGSAMTQSGMLQWVAAAERLLVLALLVMFASGLISAQVAAFRSRDEAEQAAPAAK
jgi:hypothetical protein